MPLTQRLAGILVHPTSLPGPFGIGDIGLEAYRLLDWMNAEFHWGCCTVYAEEDHRYPLDPATATCNTAVTPCSEEAGLCAALTDPDTCESLMALLDLDIDSDGDGENDAMSVGLHFKATSARIGWIEGCGPAPTDPK